MIKLNGYYSLCDFDPGEPFFMIPYSGSPSGYAGIDDIRSHPWLIDSATRYTYNGVELTNCSNASYKNLLTGDGLLITNPPFYHQSKGDGSFIFPPHSTFALNLHTTFLLLDTTGKGKQLWTQKSQAWLQKYRKANCSLCKDSFVAYMNNIWNIGTVKMDSLVSNRRYNVILYSKRVPLKDEYTDLRSSLPTLDGTLYSRNRTYRAGIDYKFPSYLLNADGTLCVDDTCMNSPRFTLFSSGHTAPSVEPNQVHYLQNGSMDTSVHHITLSINANQGVIPPFDDWTLYGDVDSLQIKTEYQLLQ